MDGDFLTTASGIVGLVKNAADAIGSLKDQFKGNKDAERKLDEAGKSIRELGASVVTFQEKSLRLLHELGDLQRENKQLREQIGREEIGAAERQKYRRKSIRGSVVMISEDEPEFPCCANCFAAGHIVPLQKSLGMESAFAGGTHQCTRCNKFFNASE